MYFITNNEGLIVAASGDFMSKIGSRDICSISSMLNDKTIDLVDNKLLIKNKNLEFDYKATNIYSVIGNLNLYKILEEDTKTVDENNNISSTNSNQTDIPILNNIQDEDENFTKENTNNDAQKTNNIASFVEDIKVDNNIKIPEIPKEALEDTVEDVKLKVAKAVEAPAETLKEVKDNISDKVDDVKDAILDKQDDIKEEIEKTYETVKIESNNENEDKIDFTPKEYISKAEDKIEDVIKDLEDKKDDIIDTLEEDDTKKKKLFSNNIFPWSKKKEKTTQENIKNEESDLIDDLEDLILLDTKEEIENKKTKEKEEKEDNLIAELNLEDTKKETEKLAKNIDKIDIEEEIKNLQTEEKKVEEELKKEKKEAEKPNELIEKIISTQVNAIDFQKNADKLSIDLNSYKMLLNSYLGEIEKYLPELKDSNSQIIDMLIDAGKLLSLDTVTSKLSELKNEAIDKVSKIKELDTFTRLLKIKSGGEVQEELISDKKADETEVAKSIEEAETKKTEIEEEINKEVIEEKEKIEEAIKEVKEEPKVTEADKESIKDEIFETLEKEPEIPEAKMVRIEDTYSNNIIEPTDNIIEITTAEELLDIISPIDVNLNPKIASEELNLPEELIVEFIYDFLKQSKEHLPIMVEAYLRKDIEKIQSTAHMLKGAANNLRLNKIADNLYKIQKENELKNDKYLIKKFVGQIKGLEIELKNLGE